MKIKENELPAKVVELIRSPDPLKGEDIIIESHNGDVVGVIIQPEAYAFFVNKVEEEEDKRDSLLKRGEGESSKSLDELMEETRNEK